MTGARVEQRIEGVALGADHSAPPSPGSGSMAPSRGRLARLAPALGNTEYRYLFFSLLPGTLGMMMAMVAFGYVAYQRTGSAGMLALTTAGHGISMALLSPLAGTVADRMPRLTILRATQLLLGLTAVVVSILLWTDTLETWHLVAISIVQGMAFAFNMPSRQAYIAELVPPADLPNAIAMNNAGLNFNRVLGPAVAGVLLSWPGVGPLGVFVLMAALYGVVIVALIWMPEPPIVVPRGRARGGVLDGLRYVMGNPTLRRLMFMAALPTLFGMPYQTLMPATADRVFGVDAAGLGALLTANGVGALVGSIVIAGLTRHGGVPGSGAGRLRRVQLVAGTLLGVAVTTFGLVGHFLPALAIVAVAGGASATYMAVNTTLLIQRADRAFHGRVMSVYMMAFAALPLGSVPAAWIADQVGLPVTIAVSGVACAASVLLLGRNLPPDEVPAPSRATA